MYGIYSGIYSGSFLKKLLGDETYNLVLDIGIIICLIICIYRGYYRKTGLYKRIMGDKAKPCLYDGRGNRIRNPDGTPIAPPEEQQEAEAGGNAPEGELEGKAE